MPYELVSVASCFHNILGSSGANSADCAKRTELLKAILNISKETSLGGPRRSKFRTLNSEETTYTPERVISLLNAGYSEICAGGAMIFTLPYNIIDELRTCNLNSAQSETMSPSIISDDASNHPCLDDNASIYFERMREERDCLRRKALNEYSPAHGDLVYRTLPPQLLCNSVFSSTKRAYFVVNNTTTPPSISIKVVDQMKLGDRFCHLPSRVYSLERVYNTHNSMEHRSPFVIGELIVICNNSSFTKSVHTWSSATTVYCKRHTQFDGSCCITASQGTTSYNTLHAHLRTEYTLQVHTKKILVSSYLMSWLRISNQNIFPVSESFFAEKMSINKLLSALQNYSKTIDRYKSLLTFNCSTDKQSSTERKSALIHQDLIGSLPSHVIELSNAYDFLVHPYCSLVANSPIPYVPSSIQARNLQRLLGDASDTCLNSQPRFSFANNCVVDVSPVFCCGSINENLMEESNKSCNKVPDNIRPDNTSQCTIVENRNAKLVKDEEPSVEPPSDATQSFPTYKALYEHLCHKITLSKTSQIKTHAKASITSLLSALAEATEPQIKREGSHASCSNNISTLEKCERRPKSQYVDGHTVDTLIHDLVYRELFGDPLKVCGLNDRYDYVLNYHYRRSFDGYFHFNHSQSNNCISPLNCSSDLLDQYNRLGFYNILNVMQRRYTQLAIHNPEIYALLKDFHTCKISIQLFIKMLSHVTDSLRAYPFGGLFVSLLCHMWLAYDVTDELNCMFTAVWTLFGHSATEVHISTSLSEIFSYTCGNVIIERYLRHTIPWYQRPQTILEFLLLKVQPTKAKREVCDALRDLFRFTAVVNRTRAWYG